MLSFEAAQAALIERREEAKPSAARGRVSGVVGRVAGALSDYEADRSKLVTRLGMLGRRGRRLAFGAAVPGLGGEAADLFEGAGRLTYQGAWDRRPFRAPRAPELARERVLDALAGTGPELVAHAADPVWLARWGGYLAPISWSAGGHLIGWLLATAIDSGNDEVFEILLATIDGSDDVATMGHHVPVALLCAEREQGWERIEQLLLGAQRQEGLRQSILEVVDEARPQALQRMLGLILEHELVRFSSVARAVSVWLGLEMAAAERQCVAALVRQVLGYLADPARAAAADGQPLDRYLALWSIATLDVHRAIEQAEPLLDGADPERRFAAVRFLAQTRVQAAIPGLTRALRDDDLRVAATACTSLWMYTAGQLPESYDALEALLARLPKKTNEVEAVSWLGALPALKRQTVADLLLDHVDPPQLQRVLPHAKALSTWQRGRLVDQLAKGPLDAPGREALLAFLSDPSPDVRHHAIAATSVLRLTDEEARGLEPLLKRRSGDLRRGLLELITSHGERWALGAAGRLLAGDEQQRLAAVDLLRRVGATDSPHAARARDQLAKLDAADGTAVGDATRRAVQDDPLTRLTEADGFGLFRDARLTIAIAPRRTGFNARTAAALRVIELLDELIDRNAEAEILVDPGWGPTERVVLGAADALNLRWHELRLRRGETDVELPLRELWTAFAENLPSDARDADGQQILRAYLHCCHAASPFDRGEQAKVASALRARYAPLVSDVLDFLVFIGPDEQRLGAALDAAEDSLARVTRRQLAVQQWRWDIPALDIVRNLVAEPFADDCVELTRRHWQLERWVSEHPAATAEMPGDAEDHVRASSRRPVRPADETVAMALARGIATEADLIDHLVGPRGPSWEFSSLARLSTQRGREQLAGGDRVAAVVERIRDRVVSIELSRGEAPTPAAAPVLALRMTGGLDVLVAALRALGSERLVRGWAGDGEGRATVFSHMLAASAPGDGDTPERFGEAMKSARVSDRRLREVACYTPQWARHVEAALELPGLSDAVWWLHAHTKDDRWRVDENLLADWSRAVAERTALSSDELIEGAVDVAWFGDVRERLGDAELDLLLAAAKYGSTSGGHKRAELFARAMRGELTDDELVARIEKSRHQDCVRAIGLLPLPSARTQRDATIARRYELLQEYKRQSRQFGRQRQASEGRATEIAMENLARTAGFVDPVRLSWAMEAHATADLAADGVTVEHDGISVRLSVDDEGRPIVDVKRGDKALKAVPAKLRRTPQIQAVTQRTTQLRRQASRIRASLEQAMIRGDELTGAELAGFHDHVLLWPSISRLVLVGEGTAGFPDRAGRVLRDPGGAEHAVGRTETLRIAHPVDLLGRDWAAWQRHVMSERLVQPFKQVPARAAARCAA